MRGRSWCTVAVVPAVGAVLVLAAGPAWAKSDLSLTVSTHSARVGHSVRITASGGDDASEYGVACVQLEHRRNRWSDLACSRPEYAVVEEIVHLREKRAGTVRVRAVLYDTDSRGHHRYVSRISAPTTIRYTR